MIFSAFAVVMTVTVLGVAFHASPKPVCPYKLSPQQYSPPVVLVAQPCW